MTRPKQKNNLAWPPIVLVWKVNYVFVWSYENCQGQNLIFWPNSSFPKIISRFQPIILNFTSLKVVRHSLLLCHQQTDPPCSNMFGNSRAGPSGHRLEHVLGCFGKTCLDLFWATILNCFLNCFKCTKIQGFKILAKKNCHKTAIIGNHL